MPSPGLQGRDGSRPGRVPPLFAGTVGYRVLRSWTTVVVFTVTSWP